MNIVNVSAEDCSYDVGKHKNWIEVPCKEVVIQNSWLFFVPYYMVCVRIIESFKKVVSKQIYELIVLK